MTSSNEALSSSSVTATALPCSVTVIWYWLAESAAVSMRTPSVSASRRRIDRRLLYRMKLTVRPG